LPRPTATKLLEPTTDEVGVAIAVGLGGFKHSRARGAAWRGAAFGQIESF